MKKHENISCKYVTCVLASYFFDEKSPIQTDTSVDNVIETIIELIKYVIDYCQPLTADQIDYACDDMEIFSQLVHYALGDTKLSWQLIFTSLCYLMIIIRHRSDCGITSIQHLNRYYEILSDYEVDTWISQQRLGWDSFFEAVNA